MIDSAEFVVHGTVIRSWAGWDQSGQFIWTHYEIQVADSLKGKTAAKIVVSEPGGKVGEQSMLIVGSPRYTVGEEVILLTERTPIGYLRSCGWGQGKFTVSSSDSSSAKVVQSQLRGVELVDPIARKGASARRLGTAVGALSGLPLDEFKARLSLLIQARTGGGRNQ